MSNTKLCPYCQEEIRANAIKCKHCGSMLTENQTTPLTPGDSITLIKNALFRKYEIKEIIGKGGMASVYKALQKSLDKAVVLKVIHLNFVHDQEFLDRFIREAKISASLNHSNIVQTYDVGNEGIVYYISMEYLDGEDLYHIIHRKGKLSIEETIRYISPIAEALDFAHKKKIIHRDIKSSNIIVTPKGRPVLTDFGIANAASGTNLTLPGSVIGTPEYMSPEQAEGRQIDHRSDLYSLGIVMYECLTGTLPFRGDNPLTTIHKIIYTKHKPIKEINKGIPPWLNSISEKLLEKTVENRFKSGRELVIALSNKKLIALSAPHHLEIPREKIKPQKQLKLLSPRNKFIYGIIFSIVIVALMLVYLFLKQVIFKTNNIDEPGRKGNSSGIEFGNNGTTSNKPPTNDNQFEANDKKDQIISLENQAQDELRKDLVKAFDTSIHLLEIDPGNKIANGTLGKIKAQLIQMANNFYSSGRWSSALNAYSDIKMKFGDDNEVDSKIAICREKIEENKYVHVPDIIGKKLNVAKESLQRLGLILGTISKLPRPADQFSTVIVQFPVVGTRVKKGSSVNLTIGE